MRDRQKGFGELTLVRKKTMISLSRRDNVINGDKKASAGMLASIIPITTPRLSWHRHQI
jgi:hypothetical protein